MKATETVKRAGSSVLERGQAASLGPHPVSDRGREAEQPRRQRMDVDRVQVARDGAVAAAEVARQPPGGGGGQACALGRSDARVAGAPSWPPPRRRLTDSSSQTSSSPTRASLCRANCVPRGMGLQRSRPDAQGERLAGADRPVLGDPVGDVDEADGRVGKVTAGHQRPAAAGRPACADRWAAACRERANPHTRS